MAENVSNLEEQLQARCYQWFWNNFPDARRRLFHIQQKARNRMEGARFKAIGVTRGIADLGFILRNGKTMYIELKVGNNTQSVEQVDFQRQCTRYGAPYIVIRTFEEFSALIKTWL